MFNNKSKLLMSALALTLVFFLTGCSSSSNVDTNNNEDTVLKQAVREPVSYDELKIKKSDITDIAKFYPVMINGVKMEVIAALATDGTIRTAFNACQVCASSGRGYYIQVGHKLVCQNCGNEFDIDELGIARGGCNPAPIQDLDKIDDGEYITIPNQTFLNNINLY